MVAPIQVNLRLNRASFDPALRRLGAISRRLPHELLNKQLYHVAARARRLMPVVTAAQISGELAEYKVTVRSYSRKGKLLGKGKATASFFDSNGTSRGKPVPLLALIISARVRSGTTRQPGMSNYNKRTGMVFAITKSPWAGVKRAIGAERMRAAMLRVHSARRKSSGFYKVCAHAVMFLFRNAMSGTKAPPMDGGGDSGVGGSVSSRLGRIAGGSPATPGLVATASFWVADTEPSSKGGTMGLQRIAEPVWQQALNDEASGMMREAEKRYAEAIREAGFTVK